MSRRVVVVFLLLFASACAPSTTVRRSPEPLPEARPVRVALVLGGGGARGFAHVGVLRVLEQEKIPISLIVGTSVGSLIGALYADCADTFELEAVAWQLEKDDLFDYSIFGSSRGPVVGEALERFLHRTLKALRFEDLKVPFAAVATDLATGEEVVLDRGPIAPAVRASSAIPGVFRPVTLDGRTLVDGGVVDPLPVSIARARGADVVIAVDITRELPREEPGNLAAISLQSLAIMTRALARLTVRDADVIIAPQVGATSPFDFTRKKELMAAGVAAARQALPALRRAIEEASRTQARPN